MTSSSDQSKELLKQLITAFNRFRDAKAAREKLNELGSAGVQKGKEIHEQMTKTAQERSEPLDAAEWNRRFDALPEEQEITRILDDEKTAAETVRMSRQALHTSLDHLRSPNTRDLFEVLDSLPLYPWLEITERYVGLVELILTASARKPGRTLRPASDKDLDPVRLLIKQCASQGLTHAEICDRLRGLPRPPRAAWRHLDWPVAFEKNRAGVKAWISKAIHSSR